MPDDFMRFLPRAWIAFFLIVLGVFLGDLLGGVVPSLLGVLCVEVGVMKLGGLLGTRTRNCGYGLGSTKGYCGGLRGGMSLGTVIVKDGREDAKAEDLKMDSA